MVKKVLPLAISSLTSLSSLMSNGGSTLEFACPWINIVSFPYTWQIENTSLASQSVHAKTT